MKGSSLPRSTQPVAAFSMVEVIVTITILSILAAAAAFGWQKSWRSQQILACATRLTQDLQLARSMAIKRGMPVEVRFYRNRDPTLTTGDRQYKTWQLVGYDSREKRLVKLGELQRFEGTVIISSFPSLSSVTLTEVELDPTRDPLPNRLRSRFSTIEFRPDGSTSLDPDPLLIWTLTLVTDGHAADEFNLPPDIRTLVITAENGSVTMH